MRTSYQTFTLACLTGLSLTAQTLLAGVGYKDTPMLPGGKWHVHDSDRPMAPVVKPATTFSLGAPAPADAVVLFDGTDLSKWAGNKGDAKWKLENGYMEAVKGTGNIHTRDTFGDCQIHLEWAEPPAKGESQERGNSGVFLMGRFEIQVLDCFDNLTYADGQCAAVYGQTPPLANACKPPGEWQSYDIFFETAKWDADGKLLKLPTVTVIQNGVLVQNHTEILGTTGHRSLPGAIPRLDKGPLELQDHNNPIRYRNVWIRPLAEKP